MISFLLSVPQYIRFILITLYVASIVALSLLPPQNLPQVVLFRGADKVIHLSMYLIFSLLGCWTLKTEENRAGIFLILPVTIGWGLLMEFIQLEMHLGRSFSWFDILANTTGALTGILIYVLTVYAPRK
jgi:VanZ family protein